MQIGRVGKIVAAGTLAALMAGSSLAFAQLQNLPAPFVTSAGPQSLVVVGAAADPSDVVGAIDIAARLGGEVTTDVAVPGGAALPSVVGEGRFVGTSNERIFLDDNMTKTGLRTAMSSDDLPTILKSGTVQGTNLDYDYDVFFNFGEMSALDYKANDNVDIEDPEYVVDMGSTINSANAIANQFFYRTRVVFNDELNVTDTANDEIALFGGEYTVSSDSTSSKLVLFGSARKVVLQEGQSSSLEVEGTTHTITLVGVSDANTVVVEVNGKQETMDTGQSRTISDIDVFIADVFFLSKETQVSSAEIGLGARKLTFETGNKVKLERGGATSNIDGTFVNLTTTGGKISRVDVFVVGEDSTHDLLSAGQSFNDPVWGNIEVNFNGMTSAPKGADRDKIDIRNSGTKELQIRFTDDRGRNANFDWAHITSSTDTTPDLADNNNDPIEVVENASIAEDAYFIVDAGDFSRMFEVTDIDNDASSDADITLRDVFSGNEVTVTLGTDNRDEKIIDGQTYFFDANPSTTAGFRVTWGTGAAFNVTGSSTTVYPKLETQKGAEIAFTKNVTLTKVPNGHVIQLPTGAVTVNVASNGNTVNLSAATTEDGDATVLTGAAANFSNSRDFVQVGRTSNGGRWFSFSAGPSEGVARVNLTIGLATADGTAIDDPTVLLVEEEDDDNDVYTLLVQGDTETRSGNEETSVGTIDFSYSGATEGVALDSDSDFLHSVDKWGTFVEEDTDEQDVATVWYPDDQVSANVFVLAPDATVSTGGSTGGGTIKAAVPIKTALGKLDTEVTDADKNTKNLILVGGPAVNTLVADLGAAGKTRDLQWYRDQGEGTALIDHVADAFVAGKAALVVAGHSAADTRVAASRVQNFDTSGLTGSEVVLKNGVITTATA